MWRGDLCGQANTTRAWVIWVLDPIPPVLVTQTKAIKFQIPQLRFYRSNLFPKFNQPHFALGVPFNLGRHVAVSTHSWPNPELQYHFNGTKCGDSNGCQLSSSKQYFILTAANSAQTANTLCANRLKVQQWQERGPLRTLKWSTVWHWRGTRKLTINVARSWCHLCATRVW